MDDIEYYNVQVYAWMNDCKCSYFCLYEDTQSSRVLNVEQYLSTG